MQILRGDYAMTDTPDWADEEAFNIEKLAWCYKLGDDKILIAAYRPDISTALRAAFLRGRIAGLREAAEMAAEAEYSSHYNIHQPIFKLVRDTADKLEDGN